MWWNFVKMQIIFKAIAGSSGYAFKLLWRRLFDAGLVALESISPGQRIYYGTLRCHTLPSKENFPRQRLPPWFFATDFSLARTVPHFPSHQGAWPELPVTALNITCILSKSITPQSWKHISRLCTLIFGPKSVAAKAATAATVPTPLVWWTSQIAWVGILFCNLV